MSPDRWIMSVVEGLLKLFPQFWKARALLRAMRGASDDEVLDVVSQGSDDNAILAKQILASRQKLLAHVDIPTVRGGGGLNPIHDSEHADDL